MNVLGITWTLGSSAALFKDEAIVSALNEERFTRFKNDETFPVKSIEYVLKTNSININALDGIAIASKKSNLIELLKRMSRWTIQDYVDQQHKYWKPIIFENKQISEIDLYKNRFDYSILPIENFVNENNVNEKVLSFSQDRIDIVANYLNYPKEKIHLIEHHNAHSMYAYYSSPFRNEPVLCFTIDAHGDGLNATIGIFDETGKYTRVFETANCYIARIYRYMTLLLGMKPNEHEYKLMGLAPYGKGRVVEKPYNVFKNTLAVDGLDFKWIEKPTDSYFWFKEKLEGCRFDGIAAGLQKWVEEIVTEWISNAIEKFGIQTIVLSGGVSMNIKANGMISELPSVKKMFVGGTGSDESLAIGSAFYLAEQIALEKKANWNSVNVQDMKSLYLGTSYDKQKENSAIQILNKSNYSISENFTSREIAEFLYQGKILARCTGKMEFGQRSLGNRSILADPIDTEVISKINQMIKNRDFWMPFAPVILDTYVDEYLINPKQLTSPHMTIAFKTKPRAWKDIAAGCHPADKTARAQILTQNCNPFLYEILSEFERISGRGGLLNTSFNLHGHPIVNTPEEAIDVLLNSSLDGLILNHFLILKK